MGASNLSNNSNLWYEDIPVNLYKNLLSLNMAIDIELQMYFELS